MTVVQAPVKFSVDDLSQIRVDQRLDYVFEREESLATLRSSELDRITTLLTQIRVIRTIPR